MFGRYEHSGAAVFPDKELRFHELLRSNPQILNRLLGPRFKNQIEGSLGGPAADAKASFLHDQLSQLSFAGLRPLGRAGWLGQ